MTDKPRIRDLYGAYEQGRIPFEEVVRAADRVLDRFAAAHGPAPLPESRIEAPGITQRD